MGFDNFCFEYDSHNIIYDYHVMLSFESKISVVFNYLSLVIKMCAVPKIFCRKQGQIYVGS